MNQSRTQQELDHNHNHTTRLDTKQSGERVRIIHQSTSSMLGPPAPPPGGAPGMPPGMPPMSPPPPCEYMACMIGEQTASTSLRLSSNSSFSAIWLPSSHESAPSTASLALALSSSEILSLTFSSSRVFF